MYLRNSTSPERLAIGPVVLIADGTVQTAGVSVTVLPQGGVAAPGAGVIEYQNGIVHYTPTQAETNYTSFTLTAYKANCWPVSVSVVTSVTVLGDVQSAVAALQTAITALQSAVNALEANKNIVSKDFIVRSNQG